MIWLGYWFQSMGNDMLGILGFKAFQVLIK